MHPTAMINCQRFFETYAQDFVSTPKVKVIDIGAQDVNGSLRAVCPKGFDYVGVDFEAAKGVDIVLADPYTLPFDDASVDIVLSSSCFEHAEMFWLTFLEILRVLKPNGLFYLNAPSAGSFHRYPVDCWRFYPDSGRALVKWAQRNRVNAALLESFTQDGGGWQDFVAVFLKDERHADRHVGRIIHGKKDFENGLLLGDDQVLNLRWISQNERKLQAIGKLASTD